MSLQERLKIAREFLRYSQKDMAKALDTNPQTWQIYESGKSVPGGKVLEALARIGFDVNWLLTGEGQMLRPTKKSANPDVAQKLREIRGERSIKELAEMLGATEDDIEGMEAGDKEPGLSFLSAVNYHLNINPLYFMRQGVDLENYRDTETESSTSYLDSDLLTLVFEVVQELDQNNTKLSPKQKAELAALVYQMNQHTKYTKERLHRFIEAICIFIEQGIDFNKLSERKLSNIIIEIAQHVVKGGDKKEGV
jgi:transcriptional regulator with XRE-family HTH domain